MSLTLTELVNRTSIKLDQNIALYPQSEIVVSGINPAQRLIAYSRKLLTRRVTATVAADAAIIDLRVAAPRCWRMQRVVLGTITGDQPSVSGYEYRDLLPTTLPALAWRRNWLVRKGPPSRYWVWGDHWLGIYPRPVVDITVTLVFLALPLAFSVNDLYDPTPPAPELPEVYHPLVPDIAFALLIIKEGITEVDKAQAILTQTFGQEYTKALRRVLRQTAATPSAALRASQAPPTGGTP